PVAELLRLYRLVNSLIDYHNAVASLPAHQAAIDKAQADLQLALAAVESETDKKLKKKAQKNIAAAERKVESTIAQRDAAQKKIAAIETDESLFTLAREHAHIGRTVLQETAKLHEGDPQNLALWHEVLPYCR